MPLTVDLHYLGTLPGFMCSVLCDTTMNEGLGITPNVGPHGATLAPPSTATCTCHPRDARRGELPPANDEERTHPDHNATQS